MKVAIVYESTHHGNTLKLVQAIARKYEVELIDAAKEAQPALDGFDVIGFAAGIAYNGFYKRITGMVKNGLPAGKKVFFLYTCGKNSRDFSQTLQQVAVEKGCTVLGSYGCTGFDTYGPLKLIGGLNKNHPDQEEIDGAVRFYEERVTTA